MDAPDFLAALAKDGGRISQVAPGCLASEVPGCPGWKVRDLVAHLGGVYSWATLAVEAGGERPTGDRAAPPTNDDELMPWFDELLEGVKEALGNKDPAAPAWTFSRSDPHIVGWWQRRQAQETSVHRYDVEASAASASPIPAELASDGVDEFLTTFFPAVLTHRPVENLRGTLHVHATDTPGEWWMDLDSPGDAVRLEHAKADTAIRGPASELNLFLWNRLSREKSALETFGDPKVVDAFALVTI